jgi:MerR family transcriptional regulator/heat shock protein HspR
MSIDTNLIDTPREPVYTIGVAARKLGVSSETLRYYEKEGLLIPYRTETGRRLYSQRDLEWIRCFRGQMADNKLNVAGIRLLMALMPCWELKPCSEEERRQCPAYMNYKVVCWTVEEPGSTACQQDICLECHVYLDACRAGKLDSMYVVSRRDGE